MKISVTKAQKEWATSHIPKDAEIVMVTRIDTETIRITFRVNGKMDCALVTA